MASPTRSCPNCGETLPAEARFCGACGQTLPPLMEEEKEKERGGLVVLPPIPGAEGAAPGFSAAAQTGAPSVTSLSAGAQSGAPAVPGIPAGAQSGAPSVPTIPGGAQGAGAGAPGMPGAAQTDSTALQGAAQAAGHGLLATLPAKIIAVVVAVVVVAGGATAVLAATGTKVFGLGGSGGSQSSGSHSTRTAQSSPASQPGPNGAPPDGASFMLTISITGGGSFPSNPQNLLLVMGGKVCGPHDDGQSFTYPNPSSPGNTDTAAATCSGSYQGGKIIYTQMVMQYRFADSGGRTCTFTITSPWTNHLEGTFTSPTSISGTGVASHGLIPGTCSDGQPVSIPAFNPTFTWTGTVSTTP